MKGRERSEEGRAGAMVLAGRQTDSAAAEATSCEAEGCHTKPEHLHQVRPNSRTSASLGLRPIRRPHEF